MKKIIYIFIAALFTGIGVTSCGDVLDQDPDSMLTPEQAFGDETIITSTLANFYGRTKWAWRIGDWGKYSAIDEAMNSEFGPDVNYFEMSWAESDGGYRIWDYGLVRDINRFLADIQSDYSKDLDDDVRNNFIGEARFIRAWYYFNSVRALGGVPIVGDTISDYSGPEDIEGLKVARSTEAESYDYIISECDSCINLLSDATNTNSARANKWAAMALKARAALYAGSLAKYNNLKTPSIKTDGGEVGIPASMADGYYNIAIDAATTLIDDGPYEIVGAGETFATTEERGLNFYNATSVKNGSAEVIWAHDYVYPGSVLGFTKDCGPTSTAEDIQSSKMVPTLNLVEAFEYTDGTDGALKLTDASGDPIYYENQADLFAGKDARLWGTVIYPGSEWKSQVINYQYGQLVNDENGDPTILTAATVGQTDDNGVPITSINGPVHGSNQYNNKGGFNIRKFLDPTTGASTNGRGSDMWEVKFRLSEMYLIAAEAYMETGHDATALTYINPIRERAGLNDLTTLTIDDIVQERRAEFAFEDHRFWDLRRLRMADEVWDGTSSAQRTSLLPILNNIPGDPNYRKYYFVKEDAYLAPNPLTFNLRYYYCRFDQDWINRNDKLVQNPNYN